MIVIDIGNTNIVIATYYQNKIFKSYRINTSVKNLSNNLNTIFDKNSIFSSKLDYNFCIISSVVPKKTKDVRSFFKKNKMKVTVISLRNISKKIKFKYESSQLGSDRIANTYAAIEKFGKNSIVIDFGTATTFDVIENNIYLGGIIAPGINNSHDALVNSAAKLNKIPLKKTNYLIGKKTDHSMQSGFYWGYVSLINGIIRKIIYKKNFKPKIILTGGLGNIFQTEIKFKTFYEPNLTLNGLYLIGKNKYAQN